MADGQSPGQSDSPDPSDQGSDPTEPPDPSDQGSDAFGSAPPSDVSEQGAGTARSARSSGQAAGESGAGRVDPATEPGDESRGMTAPEAGDGGSLLDRIVADFEEDSRDPPTWRDTGLSTENRDRMELYYRRLSVLALVLGLFVLAFGLGRGVRLAADAIVGLGPPGTASRLLYGVLGLQFLGFGVGAVLVLTRRERPLSYLRIGPFDVWTVFYGTAVGLGLMLVTVGATVLARTVETGPTAAASLPTDPMYYVVLLVASTLVVAPMEEVFFRGIVQRRLEDVSHPAVAITVASLLFMTVHVTITYGSTGELISVGLFFGAGVVLGASYYLRRNLFVPVVGHAVFNGVQIVVQIVEIV